MSFYNGNMMYIFLNYYTKTPLKVVLLNVTIFIVDFKFHFSTTSVLLDERKYFYPYETQVIIFDLKTLKFAGKHLSTSLSKHIIIHI